MQLFLFFSLMKPSVMSYLKLKRLATLGALPLRTRSFCTQIVILLSSNTGHPGGGHSFWGWGTSIFKGDRTRGWLAHLRGRESKISEFLRLIVYLCI